MANEKAEGSLNKGEDCERRDEENMEKFFALIRDFHEARNRRKEELNELQEKHRSSKVRKIDHGKQSVWVPKFELQDFTEEIEFMKPPAVYPSPCNKKDDNKPRQEDDDLDLKLAL